MSAESVKTLFYPFEAAVLEMPATDDNVLFLGAEPGFRLPAGWQGGIHAVQGFRPDYLALERMGLAGVSPHADAAGFDVTLVLAGRHRGHNELLAAEALERTKTGGLVVVAGAKDDGIASLRKQIGNLVQIEGSLPKYHGIAFWFRCPKAGESVSALRSANPSVLVEDRFHTAPGMFSFDRVDAGSKLLVEHLPAGALQGHVADFCAGWGYLAAEVATCCPAITGLDLYEADFDALAAARRNVPQASGFFWHDLLSEPLERRYDAIVMNPPFHRARAAEPEIGVGMIRAAAKALKPGGRLWMVANRQLPYEAALAAFSSHNEVARNGIFKVFSARR